jgi:transcription antitermination factor NusG
MTRKVLALLLLSSALAACESNPTETNSNDNAPKASPSVVASPTPASMPSVDGTPASTSQLKPGDKVRAINGSFTEATVVSVDEKSARLTVKLQGQAGEKTVALSEVVKQ